MYKEIWDVITQPFFLKLTDGLERPPLKFHGWVSRSEQNSLMSLLMHAPIAGKLCSSEELDIRKHQISASLAFVRGIHWSQVDSPHKRPVTRKMFPFDDIITIDQFVTGVARYVAVITFYGVLFILQIFVNDKSFYIRFLVVVDVNRNTS